MQTLQDSLHQSAPTVEHLVVHNKCLLAAECALAQLAGWSWRSADWREGEGQRRQALTVAGKVDRTHLKLTVLTGSGDRCGSSVRMTTTASPPRSAIMASA